MDATYVLRVSQHFPVGSCCCRCLPGQKASIEGWLLPRPCQGDKQGDCVSESNIDRGYFSLGENPKSLAQSEGGANKID